jgi:prepilin-type N-terminal cleavage/methylation domain-containing protein
MSRRPRNDLSRSTGLRAAAAFSLVELLIVVTILGIFAGMVLTRFEPTFHDQLRGTAQVIIADLAFARSLAVANNSQYEFTFDPSRHRYWLEHSGTNPTLDTLPASPYGDPSDPPTRHTTNLRKLPSLSAALELAAVRSVSATEESEISSVEFSSLGALTQPEDCWIWLAIGRGDARRYMPVELDAVTGLARIGEFQATGPPPLPSANELVLEPLNTP